MTSQTNTSFILYKYQEKKNVLNLCACVNELLKNKNSL